MQPLTIIQNISENDFNLIIEKSSGLVSWPTVAAQLDLHYNTIVTYRNGDGPSIHIKKSIAFEILRQISERRDNTNQCFSEIKKILKI